MSESKHTPGPWKACNPSGDSWEVCSTVEKQWPDSDNLAGKSITGWGRVTQTEADARLIAAAPELLEALEECERDLSKAIAIMPRRYCNEKDAQRCDDLLAMVRAAIAKAKGGG